MTELHTTEMTSTKHDTFTEHDCRETADYLITDVGWAEAKAFADLAEVFHDDRRDHYMASFWEMVSSILDGENPAYA